MTYHSPGSYRDRADERGGSDEYRQMIKRAKFSKKHTISKKKKGSTTINNTYAEGMYFHQNNEKTPDFILGRISISKKRFLKWFKQTKENSKGYVNIDILKSRFEDGKSYLTVSKLPK